MAAENPESTEREGTSTACEPLKNSQGKTQNQFFGKEQTNFERKEQRLNRLKAADEGRS